MNIDVAYGVCTIPLAALVFVQPQRLGALAPEHGGGFAEGVEGHGGMKMQDG
jgi:hypothetical protein